MNRRPDPLDEIAKGKHAAALAAEAEARFERTADHLSWLMAEKRGRAVVWSVLEQSEVLSPTVQVPDSPQQMAFDCGRKALGQFWWHVLHALPELLSAYYALMVQENQGDPTDG